MDDEYFPTEPDNMNRAFDASNADLPPGGLPISSFFTSAPPEAPPRRASAHQAVCPFCGTLNEDATHACRQCGMENSPATRQATRVKIGPWFVWQQRNPSAPGMNWSTLMSLVEKGRITPRSVVRGPTTGQLWRFAARVKGLSREFGACWHCGADVVRAARLCTSCKRLQQPPLNPDALLETDPVAPPSIRNPLSVPRNRAPVMPPVEPVRREVIPPREVPARPQVNVPLDADDGPMSFVETDSDALPAGIDLRTFQLNDESPRGPRKSLVRRFFMAGFSACLVLLVAGYFTPQFRPMYDHAVDRVMSWLGTNKTHAAENNAGPDDSASATSNTDQVRTPAPGHPTPLLNVSSTNTNPAVPVRPTSPTDVRVGPASPGADPIPADDATDKVTITQGDTISKSADLAWQFNARAFEFEKRGDYAAAIREYEKIVKLRLPEHDGPTDVETRLQKARELLKAQNN